MMDEKLLQGFFLNKTTVAAKRS